MAKTKEELNQLKAEYETLIVKLQELNEEELNEVNGGQYEDFRRIYAYCLKMNLGTKGLNQSPEDYVSKIIESLYPETYIKSTINHRNDEGQDDKI